ncbi:MAG: SGNH/GDSL hydrolase family protein [Proteobacteria bacterium]|nr:SGNH/GDSL hydrolase family protein [Pseudomonadota bacterium]
MKQILVYSDSLTWGIIPGTRKRLGFDDRWTGFMENLLNQGETKVRVIENCLNGRRTVWDDPFLPGRKGDVEIQQVIEMHSPLNLVIIALGTNDFQSMHNFNAWHSAQGIRTILNRVKTAPVEPGMPIPPILIVVPPLIETPKGPIAPKFKYGETKIVGLAEEYKKISDELHCHYFDCSSVTTVSKVDGVHLDKDQHHLVGAAISRLVAAILG